MEFKDMTLEQKIDYLTNRTIMLIEYGDYCVFNDNNIADFFATLMDYTLHKGKRYFSKEEINKHLKHQVSYSMN